MNQLFVIIIADIIKSSCSLRLLDHRFFFGQGSRCEIVGQHDSHSNIWLPFFFRHHVAQDVRYRVGIINLFSHQKGLYICNNWIAKSKRNKKTVSCRHQTRSFDINADNRGLVVVPGSSSRHGRNHAARFLAANWWFTGSDIYFFPFWIIQTVFLVNWWVRGRS